MTQDTIEDGVSVWIIPLGIQNANQAGKVFPDRERLIHIMSGIWPRRKQLKILGGAMQDWMSLPLDRNATETWTRIVIVNVIHKSFTFNDIYFEGSQDFKLSK